MRSPISQDVLGRNVPPPPPPTVETWLHFQPSTLPPSLPLFSSPGDPFCTDCSVCSDGYAAGAHNTCAQCSDNTGAIVLMVVLAFLSILAVVAFLYYLVSTEMEGDEQGLLAGLMKRIPLQSFKIIIVTWQILTQVRSEKASCTLEALRIFVRARNAWSRDRAPRCLTLRFDAKVLASVSPPYCSQSNPVMEIVCAIQMFPF